MWKNGAIIRTLAPTKDPYKDLVALDRMQSGLLGMYIGREGTPFSANGISMKYFEMEREHGIHISLLEWKGKLKIDIILEP